MLTDKPYVTAPKKIKNQNVLQSLMTIGTD